MAKFVLKMLTFFFNFYFNRKVVTQFLEGDARFNNIFPVFDLKKNIYTARRIPGLDSKVKFHQLNVVVLADKLRCF
jgi:hypothetical protein